MKHYMNEWLKNEKRGFNLYNFRMRVIVDKGGFRGAVVGHGRPPHPHKMIFSRF
jgi:hypothetical protein